MENLTKLTLYVAIDSAGHWSVQGWDGQDDPEASLEALYGCEEVQEPVAVYKIVTLVPVPVGPQKNPETVHAYIEVVNHAKKPVSSRVMDFIQSNPGRSVKEIAEALNLRINSVSACIGSLYNKSAIQASERDGVKVFRASVP